MTLFLLLFPLTAFASILGWMVFMCDLLQPPKQQRTNRQLQRGQYRVVDYRQ